MDNAVYEVCIIQTK